MAYKRRRPSRHIRRIRVGPGLKEIRIILINPDIRRPKKRHGRRRPVVKPIPKDTVIVQEPKIVEDVLEVPVVIADEDLRKRAKEMSPEELAMMLRIAEDESIVQRKVRRLTPQEIKELKPVKVQLWKPETERERLRRRGMLEDKKTRRLFERIEEQLQKFRQDIRTEKTKLGRGVAREEKKVEKQLEEESRARVVEEELKRLKRGRALVEAGLRSQDTFSKLNKDLKIDGELYQFEPTETLSQKENRERRERLKLIRPQEEEIGKIIKQRLGLTKSLEREIPSVPRVRELKKKVPPKFTHERIMMTPKGMTRVRGYRGKGGSGKIEIEHISPKDLGLDEDEVPPARPRYSRESAGRVIRRGVPLRLESQEEHEKKNNGESSS